MPSVYQVAMNPIGKDRNLARKCYGTGSAVLVHVRTWPYGHGRRFTLRVGPRLYRRARGPAPPGDGSTRSRLDALACARFLYWGLFISAKKKKKKKKKMAVSVHELYPSLLDQCGRGDVRTVQYLLNQGLNVDYIDNKGNFPLLMASSFGRLELIKFLLDEGANIDLVNPRGESALSKAIERGQTEVASLLQQYGAKSKQVSTSSQSQSSLREVLGEEAAASTTSFEQVPKLHGHTRPEISSALKLLLPIASRWANIGVVLGVPIGIVDAIKYDNRNSCSACLREMLIEWLKQVDPPPTWENLIEAIELFDPYIAHKARTHFSSNCYAMIL